MQIVTLSSLQHFTYCQRQCALMFVERVWKDDKNTVAGSLLHENVDAPGYENDEDGVKTLRALPLYSKRYGLSGKADAVEMAADGPVPVEYKKGRKKRADHDDVQLCAQALCLEEMFQCQIPMGYIYHISSKRRREVVLDDTIRSKTLKTIEGVRQMLQDKRVPPAILTSRCDGCSLRSICMPEIAKTETPQMAIYKKRLWERDI